MLSLLVAGGLLAACGEDTTAGQSAPANPPAADAGGGSVLSAAQADQGARQWWSDHDQALAKRDATALARLDAEPEALVGVEQVEAGIATNRPIIGQPRQPSAVRVYVPAQQTLPVPILAVFDVADSGGTTRHLAVLLAERSRGAPLVALETAALDGPEPQLDVDANGYVRTIAPGDQVATLGRSATDLSARYSTYMGGLANSSPQPAPPPFADGAYTSAQGQKDAQFLSGVHAHSSQSIGAAQIEYVATAYSVPVFALKGGGGFAIFAVQRNETLQPVQGQVFAQDATRHNYGVDLRPGQYPQITVRAIIVVAARIPAGGAAIQALGSGGGIYSEG